MAGASGAGGAGAGGGAGKGGASGAAGASGAGNGGVAGSGGSGGGSTGMNLFFSEYLEGSSDVSMSGLEIFNAGTSPVDLSRCNVRLYLNGSSQPLAIALTGTLPSHDVYVVCSRGFSQSCDLVSATLNAMDGNDAVSLSCIVSDSTPSVVEDVIGQIGNNPAGGQWGNTMNGTANHTLRRSCSVTQGDSNGSDAFTPATQWSAFDADTTSDLGRYLCAGTPGR
jgi:hypothetical protein